MLTITHPQLKTRAALVANLARVRAEWQEASEGDSLIDVESSVGLLMADIVKSLDLNREETIEVLGADLYSELITILLTPGDNGNQTE